MTSLDRILYGAAYYNEYHEAKITDENGIEIAARTDEDFRLMKEAGLSVIRVAESVWQKWEPQQGVYDLEWLQPILDRAAANGISVIIGTPTYAVPRWVYLNHPEVVAHRHTGVPVPYGHRQNVDYSSPKFRELCEPLIRKMAERYGPHPTVIGWQVDNEPGAEILHNDGVFESFKKALEAEYGTVEKLNQAWGLTYWSHALANFDELWRPDGNTNPSYVLAWRQHQARITNEFLQWQREIVRSIIPASQFITTCVALSRPGMDNFTIGESLDVTSVNVYYASQDGLAHPTHVPSPGEDLAKPFWVPLHGASALNMICDTARGIKQSNFLVTETNGNSESQGPAMAAFPHFPGQFKQAAINMVSRGAEMVEYWHWHTLPYGIENHWGGVLPQSLVPGRTYESFVDTAKAMEVLSGLGKLKPAAEVALVLSTASRWAFEFQGPLRGGNGWADPLSYDKTAQSAYEIAYSNGLGVQIYGDNQLPLDGSIDEFVAKHPIMIVHSLYIASDEVLAFARRYAEAGGNLTLTPRTGFAKPNNVIRVETQPAGFVDVVGNYNEFSQLTKPCSVVTSNGKHVGSGYGWLDESNPIDGAEVALRLDHPFFGEFAALTKVKLVKGTVRYLAVYPDAELSKYIGAELAREIGFASQITSSSESVIVNRAQLADGRNAYFVFNWSWQPAQLNLGREFTAVIDETPGEISAWGVSVFTD
ncbi:MAG: beta-galactosidase [Micrococcales bacterium]